LALLFHELLDLLERTSAMGKQNDASLLLDEPAECGDRSFDSLRTGNPPVLAAHVVIHTNKHYLPRDVAFLQVGHDPFLDGVASRHLPSAWFRGSAATRGLRCCSFSFYRRLGDLRRIASSCGTPGELRKLQ
jgi:hypothetical protein